MGFELLYEYVIDFELSWTGLDHTMTASWAGTKSNTTSIHTGRVGLPFLPLLPVNKIGDHTFTEKGLILEGLGK